MLIEQSTAHHIMMQVIRVLFTLLPALASLAQAANPKPSPTPKPTPCNVNNIRFMDVASCTCEPHHTTSAKPGCNTCGWQIKERHTWSCIPGCVESDWDAQGCGLYFSTLCDCLKGGCKHTGQIKKDGDMIWVLTPKGEKLVTTSDKIAGIKEMVDDHKKYNSGWDFAQDNYLPGTQALALNSLRSRTHEQIHIHVCTKPDSQKDPRALKILSHAALNPTNRLLEVKGTDPDKPLYCMSVEQPKGGGVGRIEYFATALHNFFQEGKICEGLTGAGIIRDYRNVTWACATGNKDGPLAEFCIAGS